MTKKHLSLSDLGGFITLGVASDQPLKSSGMPHGHGAWVLPGGHWHSWQCGDVRLLLHMFSIHLPYGWYLHHTHHGQGVGRRLHHQDGSPRSVVRFPGQRAWHRESIVTRCLHLDVGIPSFLKAKISACCKSPSVVFCPNELRHSPLETIRMGLPLASYKIV